MEIKLQIGVISRDNSEYCHYAIPENRAQDREKPRKISRIRAWGERGGLAHPKHRLSTRNPSPRAGASGNETRVASVRNPKSRIQNHVSALRRSELGQGRGQAIGARMRGSAPWKTEETIVGLPRLLVLSVLLTFRIFEPCADSLTPDGLGRCRKRRNFGAHRSLVQSCGCGSAALGSPDLILQIWWLSPFTSPAHVLAHRIPDFFSLRSMTEDHRPESGIDHGVPAMRRSDKPESPVLRSPTSCDISNVPFSLLVPFSDLLRY